MTDSLSSLSSEDTYLLIREGEVGQLVQRDVIRVSGPDARSYLQGQCSQDLDGVGVGGTAETMLFSPQGKVEGMGRLIVVGDDEILYDTESGEGEAAYERLRRFRLRVRADLELLQWPMAVLRGPLTRTVPTIDKQWNIDVHWPGLVGVDILGPEVTLPSDVAVGADDAFEAARIEAGIPLMRSEISDKTIPPETGIVDRTVSFTKGCFTGQELVARLDARGNRVPRHLRGIIFSGPDPSICARQGAGLWIDDLRVGEVTSAAYSPGAKASIALSYVGRNVSLPAVAMVSKGTDSERVTIIELPIVS